jgi:hypothetical protein
VAASDRPVPFQTDQHFGALDLMGSRRPRSGSTSSF